MEGGSKQLGDDAWDTGSLLYGRRWASASDDSMADSELDEAARQAFRYPDPPSSGNARRVAESALRYAVALASRATDDVAAQDIAAAVVASMARHGLEQFDDEGRRRAFIYWAVRKR